MGFPEGWWNFSCCVYRIGFNYSKVVGHFTLTEAGYRVCYQNKVFHFLGRALPSPLYSVLHYLQQYNSQRIYHRLSLFEVRCAQGGQITGWSEAVAGVPE